MEKKRKRQRFKSRALAPWGVEAWAKELGQLGFRVLSNPCSFVHGCRK